jgi:hypothetical protein
LVIVWALLQSPQWRPKGVDEIPQELESVVHLSTQKRSLVFCTEQLVPTKSPAVGLPDGRGGLRNRRYLRLFARTERSTPSAWVNLVSQGGYQASDLEH